MGDKNFKNDFFGDDFEEKKGRKSRFLRRYPEQRFLSHIKIPIEYTVIIAIGVLVLVIIAYAVGVEKGKRYIDKKPEKVAEKELSTVEIEEKTDIAYLQQESVESKQGEKGVSEPEKAVITESAVLPLVKSDSEEIAPDPDGYGYIIQLASFKKKASAKEEVRKLKNRGIEGDLAKKGNWYQVYAEGYRTKEEAQKDLRELLPDYKDCFIRKVK